jgi:hypothetical protein
MTTRCDAERIFQPLHDLLKKLSDSELTAKNDKNELVNLLNEYWDIECPEDNACTANTCSFAKPIDWVEYHGYTCLADLIYRYNYEDDGVMELKDRKAIDPLDAPWARRNGHYNP